MNDSNLCHSILACPICKEPLIQHSSVLRCNRNHCFDRAKQGYWNLLVVQQKKSKDPGDNPDMVISRREFLDLDYYLPLADAITTVLSQQLKEKSGATILDMGCGEGYYTSQWQQSLAAQHFWGLDISKHAIKEATKRNQDITWLVASGANMPVADQSLDVLTVIFSRLMPQPFAKVLKDNGLLVLVWPTTQHLIQLKQVMYDDIKESQYNPSADLEPLFSVISQQLLEFDFNIDTESALLSLLKMTPHGQKINDQKKLSLVKNLPMKLTFSVNIGCFSKTTAS